MNKSCCDFYKTFISKDSSDQATKKLLNHINEIPCSPFNNKLTFANEMGMYFIEKINNIQVKRS